MSTKERTKALDVVERMGIAVPIELADAIRIEAAKTRESLSRVIVRRLTESYAKPSKRESAMSS